MIYQSIRPGKKPGDPNVVDLRSLKYSVVGNIYFKIDFDDEYSELPQRVNKKHALLKEVAYKKLHSERLKIKKSKFDHLQQLKPVITEDCWSFFDNLPYQ